MEDNFGTLKDFEHGVNEIHVEAASNMEPDSIIGTDEELADVRAKYPLSE